MDIGTRIKELVPGGVQGAWDGLKNWFEVERALVIVLISCPLIMATFDWATGEPFGLRASISDYYRTAAPPAFYVPLIVAAMLFFVNGVLREAHGFNAILGVLLALVVVFNKDGFWYVHYPAAGLFYAGNAVAIWRSKDPYGWHKKMLLGLGGWVLVYWAVFGARFSTALLWAEWLGLALIAIHFAYDSSQETAYQAPRSAREKDKPAVKKAQTKVRRMERARERAAAA